METSMNPLFGPAGNSDSFAAAGNKSIDDVPQYIVSMNLDAYEYQGGHGINISEEHARAFGKSASEAGIALSVHAPYYISMSSVEPDKRANSIEYILQSARAAKYMGARRVVVHSGSCAKITREQALELALDTFKKACAALDAEGLSDIHICPETMGKINQLGTVDEVMELCRLDERLIPCIDFGHINARTFGGLKTIADFEAIFETIENKLGQYRLTNFHSHFSKVEYTLKGGEKNHLTFEDRLFGPDFEPLAELVYKKGCSPIFICESAGTQAEDAKIMKNIYNKIAEGE
jgi:deoxyribonuclease-4